MIPAAAVTCVHVACAGDVCRYAPPAIGPQLPYAVEASDGTKWTCHGGLYYGPNNGAGGKVASWRGLCRSTRQRPAGDPFPAGPWKVVSA